MSDNGDGGEGSFRMRINGAVLIALASAIIALLSWYGSVQAHTQQLQDLQAEVQQLGQQIQHLQAEIDQYLLERGRPTGPTAQE